MNQIMLLTDEDHNRTVDKIETEEGDRLGLLVALLVILLVLIGLVW